MSNREAGHLSSEAMQKVIKRVGKHRGVKGVVLCDSFGLSLQSNLPPNDAENIAAQTGSLIGKVKQVTTEVAEELPTSLRIETTDQDIEIIPDFETEITIVAMLEKQKIEGKKFKHGLKLRREQ